MDTPTDSESTIQPSGDSKPMQNPPAAEKQSGIDTASGPPKRRSAILNRPKQAAKPPRKGLIFHLEIIFGVAAVLATLFTAWTPGRQNTFFASAPQNTIPQLLQPSPTFVPGAPTPSLSNPRMIGIVAGHWKNDSGAVCPDGLKEVDLNLNIATLVQKILSEQGYQVLLLQEFDPRLDGLQSAVLVSIHNDSCDFINNEATGFKVAAAFATRHPERAAKLTSCLRARYAAVTGLPLHSTSVTPDMTSYHAFAEIDENTPAAIIETGFMNLDRTYLTQQTDRVAQGVADGILCYVRNESVNPTKVSSPVPSTTVPTP
jgi:N-acetylmuramoyl-L-alanine amidase